MQEKSSIKLQIPVPWASAPACIEARGRHAVAIAGGVAVFMLVAIVITAI